jgi:hypothetical protein
MPATASLLDKLRELITHDGTPAVERRLALERLERLVRGHDGPSSIATRITRSTRIGRQRRSVAVDEHDRLAAYTVELSLADCIARIARATAPLGHMPSQIDFSCHDGDRPVIAVSFPIEEAPVVLDFSNAIEAAFPGARVNVANRANPGERLLLVYPPSKVSTGAKAA